MRCIDFAHTTHHASPHANTEALDRTGPDDGYLHGVETLISIFNKLLI